ncbi:hypothetical protein LCGC14_1187800 [marine sediment metagenome]|uniref:Uncharacterized protein n=1 Tax=marine sediment metagenome TaxID=412755 RepID=A0A0F9PQQ8_9ZZZZ
MSNRSEPLPWRVRRPRIMNAGGMFGLGPFVYWERHRNADRPEWGTWGTISVGFHLVMWDVEIEISTDEPATR